MIKYFFNYNLILKLFLIENLKKKEKSEYKLIDSKFKDICLINENLKEEYIHLTKSCNEKDIQLEKITSENLNNQNKVIYKYFD